MKEEDIIRKITEGADNPFRVPEGYFSDFTGRLMSQLPQPKRKPRRFALTVWRYAAVLLVCLGAGLAVLLASQNRGASLAQSGADTETEYADEDYINDALDYAVISGSDIELYLTEAQ
ncbi:MAG: hypothetical protein LUC44_01545 [Prevotellaceae bacterium]|nr:hypothetical protein [Prevotellaceae bacterium]